jgi:alpha-1,3-mannosylglycoprotein beta-1,4-N-acetylglucosaminyltransferase A/B
MMIEFSQLGFIGKLFKCHDLPMFVNFFLMFANDKPVDWLYDSVFSVKICNPEKGDVSCRTSQKNVDLIFSRIRFLLIYFSIRLKIHCKRSKDDLKIRFKPSLFQHVGVQSSLKGKTQKLKARKAILFNLYF